MQVAGKYYEEFAIGQTYTTGARTVTESDVMSFAGLSGDGNPMHVDHEFAKRSPFGQPIAHGLLGLSLATGLLASTRLFDGTAVALLGILDWRFVKPILFNDTIHVQMTIKAMRETSDPSRGILDRNLVLLNQRDEVLQEGCTRIMIRRSLRENGVAE